MLAPSSEDELKCVYDAMGSSSPFGFFYSGGEICPVMGEDGKTQNRFHNFTFSVCIL
jgi:hypothetical protein